MGVQVATHGDELVRVRLDGGADLVGAGGHPP
jgi:hypothetical protein